MIDTQILLTIPAFAHLPENEQDALSRVFQKKTFPINGRLFQSGDAYEWVGWILKGAVGIRHAFSDYNNGIIRAGEVIAERALLLDTQYHNQTAIALNETIISQLPISDMGKIKKDAHDLYLHIHHIALGDLSQRLSHSTNKLFAIHETSTLINTPDIRLQPFGNRILDIISSVIDIKTALFGVFEPYTNEITIVSAKNIAPTPDQKFISLASDHFLSRILESRRVTLISSQEIQKNPTWYLSHNGLIAPLSNQKNIRGVIILSHKLDSFEFSDNNVILMDIIAPLAISKIDDFFRAREQAAEAEHAQTSVYF